MGYYIVLFLDLLFGDDHFDTDLSAFLKKDVILFRVTTELFYLDNAIGADDPLDL